MSTREHWRIGELAAETGLTVRTLHHYDAIGLLVPSQHNSAGHRLYTETDVRRLHRILVLRGFGLSLAEVGALLDEQRTDVRELLQRQMDQVNEHIATANQLRTSLHRVLTALNKSSGAEPSARALIEIIEVMTTMNNRLTTEEWERLKQARAEAAAKLTPEELAEMQRKRAEFAARHTEAELQEMYRARAAMLPESVD